MGSTTPQGQATSPSSISSIVTPPYWMGAARRASRRNESRPQRGQSKRSTSSRLIGSRPSRHLGPEVIGQPQGQGQDRERRRSRAGGREYGAARHVEIVD